MKLGYPELEQKDEGISCCENADQEGFTCDVSLEKVVLPDPPQNSLGDGGSVVGAPTGSVDSFGTPLNNAAGGPGLDLDAGSGLQGIGSQLTQQFGAGGVNGIFGMVMGIVYPSLKPLMEASIRRATIQVKWKEGPNQRELTIVQYLTQPQRGGFIQGGLADGGGIPGLPTSTSGTSSPAAAVTSMIPGLGH